MIRARIDVARDARHDLYSVAAGSIDDKHGDDKEHLNDTDPWAEAVFFVVAGKSRPGMKQITRNFAPGHVVNRRNHHIYDRLTSETRTTLAAGWDIRSGAQLARCRYLRAVIDEALRMAPPSLGTSWRQQARGDDGAPLVVVDGRVIPRGTAVGVSLYSLLHNPAYFPDPFAFRPERWLDDGDGAAPGAAASAARRTAFAPFALGDRGCAGRAVVYSETSQAAVKTLWYFDFKKAGPMGGGTPGRREWSWAAGQVSAERYYHGRLRRPSPYYQAARAVLEGAGPGVV